MSQAPVAEKRPVPVWLRTVAGTVFMFGYWVCMVLASVPLLPAGTFPDFQVSVMLMAALLAGALALLTVRRQRTFLLALMIPVLVVLYLFLFTLMQTPTRHAGPLEPTSIAFFAFFAGCEAASNEHQVQMEPMAG